MSSSMGSGGVVGEGAGRSAETVVERDRGGEREEAHFDAGCEAVEGAGAVSFEGEQVFAGLEDRFDALTDRREVWPVEGLVSAARPDDRGVEFEGGGLELAAGVAFVADYAQVAGSLAALKQGQADVAFGGLGRGEQQRAWRAVQGEEAVEAETPEVAAVACAVAVVGGVAELAAPGRLDAAGALDRGRIDQHQVVVEAGAVAREHRDQPLDRVAQPLPALQIAGPVRQHREQMRELLASGPNEPAVRADPHDRLRDSQRDDLRVGQDPPGVLRRLRQEIVSRTEHSNQQQVEVGEHRVPPRSTVRIGTADFDLTATGPYPPAATSAVELFI